MEQTTNQNIDPKQITKVIIVKPNEHESKITQIVLYTSDNRYVAIPITGQWERLDTTSLMVETILDVEYK